MASHNITQGGRVGGKKNKTVQYKISGVRLKWKLTRNETQNSWSLILEGVYCVWIALGKQTSRLAEIKALILCARVIKAATYRLHFVYSRLFASGQLRFLNYTFTCIV